MSERGERMITEQIRLADGFDGGIFTVGTTRQQLVFNERTIRVHIRPSPTNGGTLFVGHVNVEPDGSNAVDMMINTSAPLDIPYDDNENPLYIVGSGPGQTFAVMALTRAHIVQGDVD